MIVISAGRLRIDTNTKNTLILLAKNFLTLAPNTARLGHLNSKMDRDRSV